MTQAPFAQAQNMASSLCPLFYVLQAASRRSGQRPPLHSTQESLLFTCPQSELFQIHMGPFPSDLPSSLSHFQPTLQIHLLNTPFVHVKNIQWLEDKVKAFPP